MSAEHDGPAIGPAIDSPVAIQELLAAREIARALLMAERASDVFQFALDRVTPILGATFSLAMQLGTDGALLRPVAQHQWPERHRPWIGALRVRVGDGPSGHAVAERRLVEVRDVLEDPELVEWHEVARELGFRALLAAPLLGAKGPLGAVTFYFADATSITDEQRDLVRLVADQLSAAVEKAATTDALRRANAALASANEALETAASENAGAHARQQTFLRTLFAGIDESLAHADATAVVRRALVAASMLVETASEANADIDTDIDARTPLLHATSSWRERARTVPIGMTEPTVLLPTVHTSRARLDATLDLMLAHAVASCARDGSVNATLELERGFVAYRVEWEPREAATSADALELTLARALAESLGGELRAGVGTLSLVLAGGGAA